MPVRPCSKCGTPVDRGRLCPTHTTAMHNAKPHNRRYDDPRWHRLRRHVLASHRAEYGAICPGWDRPPHGALDLTVDHLVPLVDGGGMLEPGNLLVLCRSCNGRKGRRDYAS